MVKPLGCHKHHQPTNGISHLFTLGFGSLRSPGSNIQVTQNVLKSWLRVTQAWTPSWGLVSWWVRHCLTVWWVVILFMANTSIMGYYPINYGILWDIMGYYGCNIPIILSIMGFFFVSKPLGSDREDSHHPTAVFIFTNVLGYWPLSVVRVWQIIPCL